MIKDLEQKYMSLVAVLTCVATGHGKQHHEFWAQQALAEVGLWPLTPWPET